MVVQAQNPSRNFPDLCSRSVEFHDYASIGPLNLLPPFAYDTGTQQILSTTYNQQQSLQQPGASPTMVPNCLTIPMPPPAADTPPHVARQRKRRKESNDKWSRHDQVAVLPAILQPMGIQGSSPLVPRLRNVSTGLRLASDDDGSTVTSTRLDLAPLLPSNSLGNGLSAQLSKQQDDINELLKIQVEQLRLALEERMHLHSKALFTVIGEQISHWLRERDVELEKVSQKNLELEERVKFLSLETHAWQSKARSYDAMVTVLKANLQQVLMQQSRCQDKIEGWGDSGEADDATSARIDKEEQRAFMALAKRGDDKRACKKCKAKEASVLLLPCLHLCFCNDCKIDVNRCPACNFLISECIEVFLS